MIFTETIQRRRTTGYRSAAGQWIENALEVKEIRCTVVPAEGDERLIELGGLRRETSWRVFTPERVQSIAHDSSGDEVRIKGEWLRIIRVDRWSGPLGVFYDALALTSS